MANRSARCARRNAIEHGIERALDVQWPELQVVADCRNGTDAWGVLLEREPEIVFLEIRMPGQDGREVARRIEVLQATVGREIRLVPVDEVIFFEADARYTRVVHRTPDGHAEVLIRTPLKELLPQLDPARFWQIHRSTIVALRDVARVEREDDRNGRCCASTPPGSR